MKLFSKITQIGIQILLAAALLACSRFIEGDVFLDKNANNIKDQGEPVIAGIPFNVTRNQEAPKTYVTDAEGHFVVATSINEVDINYCVEVTNDNLNAFKATATESAKQLKMLEASPSPSPEACRMIVGKPDCEDVNCCDETFCKDAAICQEDDDCAKNSDGKPDCSDADCCDESECDGAEACETDEDANACPKDGSGNPKCDDSRCSSEAYCNTYSVKANQACDTTRLAKLTMTLNVPLSVDYTSRVAELSEAASGPVSVGDKFGIEIIYPSSCRFEAYNLPAALTPIGLGDAFNASTRQLLLDKAIANQPYQVIPQDSPPFGHDQLHTYVLRLEATGIEGVTDGAITIQPALTCPDGKSVNARANRISFKDAPAETNPAAFTVKAALAPECPAFGETAKLTTTIEAQDVAAFSTAVYTLHISGESQMEIDSMPSQCADKGDKIECAMDTLHLNQKSEFSIEYTMKDSVAIPTPMTFTPYLESEGAQFSAETIACQYP